jgi:hypothetical protein
MLAHGSTCTSTQLAGGGAVWHLLVDDGGSQRRTVHAGKLGYKFVSHACIETDESSGRILYACRTTMIECEHLILGGLKYTHVKTATT